MDRLEVEEVTHQEVAVTDREVATQDHRDNKALAEEVDMLHEVAILVEEEVVLQWMVLPRLAQAWPLER